MVATVLGILQTTKYSHLPTGFLHAQRVEHVQMVLSTHDASAPLILRLMNGSRKRLDTGPAFRKGLLTVQVYNVEAAHMTTLIACSPGFSFGNR